jgi:hypothetical protein
MVSSLAALGLACLALASIASCNLFTIGLGAKIDITPPELTAIVLPRYAIADFVFSGTAKDDIAVAAVWIRWNGGELPATLTGNRWSVTIPLSTSMAIPEGPVDFNVTAYDTSNRASATITRITTVDRMPPTVLVVTPTSPEAGQAVYNTRIQFRGYTYDPSQVESVHLILYRQDGSELLPEPKRAINTDNWVVSVERGKDLTESEWALLNNENISYMIVARDRAGNQSRWLYHAGDLPAGYDSVVEQIGQDDQTFTPPATLLAKRYSHAEPGTLPAAALHIDFDSDKPRFTISVPSDGAVLGAGASAIGMVLDDKMLDPTRIWAVVRSTPPGLEYRLDARILGNSAPGADAYNFEIPLTTSGKPLAEGGESIPDGNFEIIFHAVDIQNVEGQSSPYAFTVDAAVPTIQTVDPEVGGYIAVGEPVTVSALVSDENGVATVRMRINGDDWINMVKTNPAANPADPDRWSATVTIADLGYTAIAMMIEATDTTGKIARFPVDYQVDAVKPTIEHLLPDLDTPVNGMIRLRSFVSDDRRLAEVKLRIGKAESAPGAGWQDYSAQQLLIDTTVYGNATHGTESAPGSGVWEVPFFIYARDGAGNPATAEFALTIDQRRDIPVITLINLNAAATTAEQGLLLNSFETGPVIQGTVEDDDGIALDGLSYSINGGTRLPVTDVRGLVRYRSFSIDLGNQPDGAWAIEIFASDDVTLKEGSPAVSDSLGAVHFVIDSAAPSITGLSLGTGPQYRNEDFAINFTALDSHALAQIVVTRNGTVVHQTVPTGTSHDLSLLKTVGGTGLADGTYEYVITVTDVVGKSTSLTRTVLVDTASPDLAISSPAASEILDSTTYTIRGTVTDNSGKGVTALAYSTNSTDGSDGIWTSMTNQFNWSVAGVDFGAGGQGAKRLWVRASDGLNAPTVEYVDFFYDTAAPVLTETLVASVARQLARTDIGYAGTASDSNALAGLTLSINGGEATPISVAADGGWTYTYTLGADGEYELEFTATDIAGRSTRLTRALLVDRTAPEAPQVSAFANYYTNSLSVNGTAADPGASASGLARVEYWIDGLTTAWTSLSGTDSWYGDIAITTLAEGPHTLNVRGTDRAGNISAEAGQTFIIDRNNPGLTINLAANTVHYRKDAFTVSGMLTDSLDLGSGSVTVGVAVNGEQQPSLVPLVLVVDNLSRSWSQEIAIESDGSYTITVVAQDNVGRQSELSRTVIVDTTAPGATVTTLPATAVNAGASFNFGGTASDAGSGVKSVSLSFSADGSNPVSAVLTLPNWSATVDLAAALGGEGAKILYVQVEDNAGNLSDWGTHSAGFVYDTAVPVVSASGAAMRDANAQFVLSGSAVDNYGIATLAVTQRKGNGDIITVSGSGLTLDGSAQSRGWSLAGLPRDPLTPVDPASFDGGAADGTYEYRITATDLAGKTSLVSTVTVRIDTSAPGVNTITAPGAGQVGVNALGGTSYLFRGSASDAGVGLAKVWYAITKAEDAPAIGDGETPIDAGYTSITTTGNWSFPRVIPDELAEGVGYYLHVLAEDSAGNRTDPAAAVKVSFDVDRANPVAAETTVGTTNVVNRKAGFSLGGTALDSHGIATVVVSQKKDDGTALAITTAGPSLGGSAQSRSWTLADLPRDPGSDGRGTQALVDGLYEYVITVTDLAGKSHSVTRSVRFDATGPDVTITAPDQDSWANSSTVTIRGVASDLTGVRAIYYKVGALEGDLPADLSLDSAWETTGWSKATGTSSWNAGATISGEGLRTVWVRSVDTVLNLSESRSLSFGVDLSVPTLTASTPAASTNTGFTLSGTAYDSNNLATVAVTVTQRKGTDTPVSISVNPPNPNGANWALVDLPRDPGSAGLGAQAVLDASADGVYEYVITVWDVAGKSSQVTRTVRFDATDGSAAIVAPVVSEVVGGTIYSFTGTATDTGSGVKAVQIAFAPDGTGALVAVGTTSWSATVTLSTLGAEGPKNLYVQVEDTAGNLSDWTAASRNFIYDTAAPVINQSGALSRDTNTGFTLGGTATDNYGLADAAGWLLTQQKDGGSAVTIATGLTSTGATEQSRTWSIADLPRNPEDGSERLVADGTYTYRLTAIDLAGRLSSGLVLTVRVDQSAPEVNVITAPGDGQVGVNALGGTSYLFRGSASDAGVGLARVWYAITQDGAAPVIGDGETLGDVGYTYITTTGSWSFSKLIPTELAEGAGYYLHIVAEDSAGNRTVALSRTFDVDLGNPTIGNVQLNGIVLGTTVRPVNIGFDLAFNLVDSHALASYMVTRNGSAVSGHENVAISGTNQSITVSEAVGGTGLADGTYEYVVTVTDVVGKSTSLTRTVLVDTVSPELDITSPVPGAYEDSAALNISGTVTDGIGKGVTLL